jgi:hypothetical protein
MNSNVYNIHSIQKFNFHLPLSNLSLCQKGINSFGKEVFINRPQRTKSVADNIKKFNSTLKHYLHAHSTL